MKDRCGSCLHGAWTIKWAVAVLFNEHAGSGNTVCSRRGVQHRYGEFAKFGQIKVNRMHKDQKKNRAWLALGTERSSAHCSTELEYGVARGETGIESIVCTIQALLRSVHLIAKR